MNNLIKYKNLPTQADLAKALNVTEAYISMLLSGKRKNPEMLTKINRILKGIKAP